MPTHPTHPRRGPLRITGMETASTSALYPTRVAHLHRGALVGIGLILCLPLTVLFVALDNLVFLLYPHRPTQEGFEAFLRTILKFTGKSLLLVLAGAFLVMWAPVAAATASRMPFAITTAMVFYGGLSIGIAMLAAVSVKCVIRAYDRFDVSLDSVG